MELMKDLQAEESIQHIRDINEKPSQRIGSLMRAMGQDKLADEFEAKCAMAEAMAKAERQH